MTYTADFDSAKAFLETWSEEFGAEYSEGRVDMDLSDSNVEELPDEVEPWYDLAKAEKDGESVEIRGRDELLMLSADTDRIEGEIPISALDVPDDTNNYLRSNSELYFQYIGGVEMGNFTFSFEE